MIHDPIADMLTRIRNGGRARLLGVKMPKSKLKVDDPEAAKPTLCVEIRYGDDDRPVIEGIQRVSSPGRRVYVRANRIPQIRSGLGMAILSTPRGIMTDTEARNAGVGGELLAKVW